MERFVLFAIMFISFGIYCAIGLKKDYAEYKKSNHYLERNIYSRNLGVVVASVVLFLYKLTTVLC